MLNVMFRPLEDDDDMDAGEDEEFVEVPDDSDVNYRSTTSVS